jgi:hypothetical protein
MIALSASVALWLILREADYIQCSRSSIVWGSGSGVECAANIVPSSHAVVMLSETRPIHRFEEVYTAPSQFHFTDFTPVQVLWNLSSPPPAHTSPRMGVLRYCCWAESTVAAFLHSVFSIELIPGSFRCVRNRLRLESKLETTNGCCVEDQVASTTMPHTACEAREVMVTLPPFL